MCRFVLSLSVVASLILSSTVVFAQQQTPGKEHDELKALAGMWDAVLKMEDGTDDGTEVKGAAEFKMTCEGMWLESSFTADFGGMKFHGKGLDSYDASKKQYVSIWVDSMSGTPMVLSGTKEGKVTTMTGDGPGPAGTAKYKTVSTQNSNDKMTFQMFMENDGKDVDVMSIVYTRRKK